jgi:predicted metalloendopeptidase
MLFLSYAYVSKINFKHFNNNFFSTFKTWCGLERPESLKGTIQYDVHSPGKYRVNVPLFDIKKFSDAFNCKENSRMNPKDRCILW